MESDAMSLTLLMLLAKNDAPHTVGRSLSTTTACLGASQVVDEVLAAGGRLCRNYPPDLRVAADLTGKLSRVQLYS
jgi:hypothetical protein